MIEINLLPEDIKTKIKKDSAEPHIVTFLLPLLLVIIIAIHIFLALFGVARNFQLQALKNKWQQLESQRKIIDEAKKGYSELSADARIIQQLIDKRVRWSEKLNKLSLNLPSGVWFNEITISAADFVLKGSVVSLQKEEFGLLNKFINSLKNDNGFFGSFNNLDLGPVQRRVIGGYDIVDFILSGTLKSAGASAPKGKGILKPKVRTKPK
jgi:Tfp pilus assembly protein PilN